VLPNRLVLAPKAPAVEGAPNAPPEKDVDPNAGAEEGLPNVLAPNVEVAPKAGAEEKITELKIK
jgi:hypothetical protein